MRESGDRGDATQVRSPFRVVWIASGLLSVGMGIIGAFLPLVPTTPFVILAAWCFARSSPELRARLVNSRLLGPSLRDWERDRAVARRAKISATFLLALVLVMSIVLGFPGWVIALQAVAAVGVLLFLWTRPDSRRETSR